MLERAVGCLESAGQGVLHKYGGVLRSRKCLEPSFWKHQLSEFDLSLWNSINHTESHGARGLSLSTASSVPDFFLDFLYPRRCFKNGIVWSAKAKRNSYIIQRRRRALNIPRNYSQTSHSRRRQAVSSISYHQFPQQHSRRTHPVAGLHDLASSQTSRTREHRDFDRAWELWMSGNQDPELRSRLMAFFSSSDRPKDVERALTLLEGIEVDKRSDKDYEITIQPLLQAGHLSAVERLCENAVAKGVNTDIWSLATRVAIKHSNWPELSYIWKKMPVDFLQRLPSILTSIQDLPNLLVSFLGYLEDTSATSADLQLASNILDFVFKSEHIMKDITAENALSLTRRSSNLGFLQQCHYDHAIQTLLNIATRESRVFALVLYRNFRWHLSARRPTKKLLQQLLETLAAMRTPYGVQFLLDEFALFFNQPSIGAYNAALLAFSRSGDVPKTQETFNNMVELYGTSRKIDDITHKTPPTPRWVASLIHAHARMADYPAAEYEFHKIKPIYKVQQSLHCWNALISAHANARNIQGAFRVWRRMQRKGVKPDWYTYGTMMGMCARLGDVENTLEFYRMAEKIPGRMPTAVIDTVVEVYCRNHRYKDAEQVAERAIALSLNGSRTRMWNVMLWSHAFRADLDSVSRLQNRMKEAGIEFDEMTYAAMMLGFVIVGKPDSARRLLRGLQRGRRIQASEFHYTLVLYGYVKQGNRDMIYLVSKEMEQRFKNPGLSARILMLRATLDRDTFIQQTQEDDLNEPGYRLALSEDLLFKAVFDFDRRQFGSKSPRPGTGNSPLHEAFPSLLYEPILQAYNAEGMHRRTLQLVNEYAKDVEKCLETKERTFRPSLRFLSVLMEVYSQAGNFEAVQKCWEMALEKSSKTLIRMPVSAPLLRNAPMPKGGIALPEQSTQTVVDHTNKSDDPEIEQTEDFEKGFEERHAKVPTYPSEDSIISAQRVILSRHLTIYMSMLGKFGQSSRLAEVVEDYKKRGFLMSSQNWLVYVRTLASSNKGSEQLEAFATFERIFMPNFPGWRRLHRGMQLRPADVPRTVDLLDKRPKHLWRKNPTYIGKRGTQLWKRVNPLWAYPTYNLMVYLAATLKDFTERILTEGREQLDTLTQIAPLTLEALATMPHLREKFQGTLLRDQAEQGDLAPRQRHRYVWTGGVLGAGGKQRPARDHVGSIQSFETELDSNEEYYSSLYDLPETAETIEFDDTLESTEPKLAPQDEHDIETEILIENRRREIGIDPLREEEMYDTAR